MPPLRLATCQRIPTGRSSISCSARQGLSCTPDGFKAYTAKGDMVVPSGFYDALRHRPAATRVSLVLFTWQAGSLWREWSTSYGRQPSLTLPLERFRTAYKAPLSFHRASCPAYPPPVPPVGVGYPRQCHREGACIMRKPQWKGGTLSRPDHFREFLHRAGKAHPSIES